MAACRHSKGTPSPSSDCYTSIAISEHVPKVFNQTQRPAFKHNPFSIPELQRALHRLKKGVVPGVDGLLTEAYQRLILPVKRCLAACL